MNVTSITRVKSAASHEATRSALLILARRRAYTHAIRRLPVFCVFEGAPFDPITSIAAWRPAVRRRGALQTPQRQWVLLAAARRPSGLLRPPRSASKTARIKIHRSRSFGRRASRDAREHRRDGRVHLLRRDRAGRPERVGGVHRERQSAPREVGYGVNAHSIRTSFVPILTICVILHSYYLRHLTVNLGFPKSGGRGTP